MLNIASLAELAPELVAGREDWEILLSLARVHGVQGFITNDDAMLNLPTEMVALGQTRLALVVVKGFGHDPIPATGLVMEHLLRIAASLSSKPQVFVLRPSRLSADRPGQFIEKLASREAIPAKQLIRRERAAMARRGTL